MKRQVETFEQGLEQIFCIITQILKIIWLLDQVTKVSIWSDILQNLGTEASDITPIISLYKLQVREIAKYLGIPKNVIAKKSSPHLWKDHEAEKELGVPYEEVDSILYCLLEKKLTIDETKEITQIDKEVITKINQLIINSEHKRLPPQRPNGEKL